jgi:aminoglycoside phosphotransferase family enzyme
MRADDDRAGYAEIGVETKVSFLSDPRSYPERPSRLTCRETHMSFVFIGDSFVYKLKKPVRFSYLDFSTLARREAACRAELMLNRRLAPTVYLDVVPLTISGAGLALAGDGPVVDWLVVMRRLDPDRMLENELLGGRLDRRSLDRLADVLASFYAHARPRTMALTAHLAEWRRRIAENRRVLSSRQLALEFVALARIDRALRRFLGECPQFFAERLKRRRIVDGHGDLRPEHIWLGEPLAVIDCLEFSAGLRSVDPFDELAFLGIECEQLGAGWPGPYLARRVGGRLHDRIPSPLLAFYRCYRATMRARLAFAHLLEPNPRTPEKWPAQGRAYLRLALREARRIERHLAISRRRPSSSGVP